MRGWTGCWTAIQRCRRPDGAAPHGRLLARHAMAAAFVLFFTLYLFAQHDAYQTHAEDLGIMDQALWNTLHGALAASDDLQPDQRYELHRRRLAAGIHFEPIHVPVSLLYWSRPRRRRCSWFRRWSSRRARFPRTGSPAAGCAARWPGSPSPRVYLLYPALDAAVTFDFHAVTLSAAFLMFALYFMLTRNDAGLFIACLLALATKEELCADVG